MLLEDLKTFVAVIDHQSITRAAGALHLTQSAISRRIQHLEEALGASLFDRNSKPPRPTPLAQRIYAQALPLLRGVGSLLDVARGDATPSGPFRLGLSQVVADVVLFDVALRMKETFPSLQLQTRSDWSTRLRDGVSNGALDAAALLLPASAPGQEAAPEGDIDGRRIATLEVLVVQRRRAPLVEARSDIAALARQDWILNPHGCGYRAALTHAMAERGHALRIGIDTPGTETQLRLVAAGLGLGLVPRSVLRHSAWRKELAIVGVADFALSLDVWLVHAKQMGNLAQAAEVLAQTVAASFARYEKAPAGPDKAA